MFGGTLESSHITATPRCDALRCGRVSALVALAGMLSAAPPVVAERLAAAGDAVHCTDVLAAACKLSVAAATRSELVDVGVPTVAAALLTREVSRVLSRPADAAAAGSAEPLVLCLRLCRNLCARERRTRAALLAAAVPATLTQLALADAEEAPLAAEALPTVLQLLCNLCVEDEGAAADVWCATSPSRAHARVRRAELLRHRCTVHVLLTAGWANDRNHACSMCVHAAAARARRVWFPDAFAAAAARGTNRHRSPCARRPTTFQHARAHGRCRAPAAGAAARAPLCLVLHACCRYVAAAAPALSCRVGAVAVLRPLLAAAAATADDDGDESESAAEVALLVGSLCAAPGALRASLAALGGASAEGGDGALTVEQGVLLHCAAEHVEALLLRSASAASCGPSPAEARARPLATQMPRHPEHTCKLPSRGVRLHQVVLRGRDDAQALLALVRRAAAASAADPHCAAAGTTLAGSLRLLTCVTASGGLGSGDDARASNAGALARLGSSHSPRSAHIFCVRRGVRAASQTC